MEQELIERLSYVFLGRPVVTRVDFKLRSLSAEAFARIRDRRFERERR